jgi:hypothetical protein
MLRACCRGPRRSFGTRIASLGPRRPGPDVEPAWPRILTTRLRAGRCSPSRHVGQLPVTSHRPAAWLGSMRLGSPAFSQATPGASRARGRAVAERRCPQRTATSQRLRSLSRVFGRHCSECETAARGSPRRAFPTDCGRGPVREAGRVKRGRAAVGRRRRLRVAAEAQRHWWCSREGGMQSACDTPPSYSPEARAHPDCALWACVAAQRGLDREPNRSWPCASPGGEGSTRRVSRAQTRHSGDDGGSRPLMPSIRRMSCGD